MTESWLVLICTDMTHLIHIIMCMSHSHACVTDDRLQASKRSILAPSKISKYMHSYVCLWFVCLLLLLFFLGGGVVILGQMPWCKSLSNNYVQVSVPVHWIRFQQGKKIEWVFLFSLFLYRLFRSVIKCSKMMFTMVISLRNIINRVWLLWYIIPIL